MRVSPADSKSISVLLSAEKGLEGEIEVNVAQVADLAKRVKVPGLGLHIRVCHGIGSLEEGDQTVEHFLGEAYEAAPYLTRTRQDFFIARAGGVALSDYSDFEGHQKKSGIPEELDPEAEIPTIELLFSKLLISEPEHSKHESLLQRSLIKGILLFMPDDHFVYRGLEEGELVKVEDIPLDLPARGIFGRMFHSRKDIDEAEKRRSDEYYTNMSMYLVRNDTREIYRKMWYENLIGDDRLSDLIRIV